MFFWIEDHIFINKINNLISCIDEMKKNNVDQLWYSWFKKNVRSNFEIIKPEIKDKNITVYRIDKTSIKKIKKNQKGFLYYFLCKYNV